MKNNFKSVLISIVFLDTSAHWSPPCCEKLSQGRVLATLMTMFDCCNRSTPHMNILAYLVNVLINHVRHAHSAVFLNQHEELVKKVL